MALQSKTRHLGYFPAFSLLCLFAHSATAQTPSVIPPNPFLLDASDSTTMLTTNTDADLHFGECVGDIKLARGYVCGIRDRSLGILNENIPQALAQLRVLPAHRPSDERAARHYDMLAGYHHKLRAYRAEIFRLLSIQGAPLQPGVRPTYRARHLAAGLAAATQRAIVRLWNPLNELAQARRGENSYRASILFPAGTRPSEAEEKIFSDARDALEVLMFQMARAYTGLASSADDSSNPDLFNAWRLSPETIPSVVTCNPLPANGAAPLTHRGQLVNFLPVTFNLRDSAIFAAAGANAMARVRSCAISTEPAPILVSQMTTPDSRFFNLSPSTLFAYGAEPQRYAPIPAMPEHMQPPVLQTDLGSAK